MSVSKLSSDLKKYIFSIVVGNALEWYDFAIFGYFAPIFSKQFFPSSSVYTSLISTFAVFAVGFLSRPLGAYFFGKLGDQLGRKRALLLSMLLIAFSTSLMGILPTYDHIGIAAPLLLTFLRILQGVSLGGEFTSSLTFIIEHAPESRKGLAGAWTYAGGFLGSVFGMVVGTIMTLFTTSEQLYSWGWRIPFLLGIIIAFFGYYLRYKVAETPAFLHLKNTKSIEASPFSKVVKYNSIEILQVIGILLPNTVWSYLFVFIPAYLTDVKHWDFKLALIVNLIPSVLLLILVPLAGYLSDIFGVKKIILSGLMLLIIFSPLSFQVFSEGIFINIVLMQMVNSFFFALSYAPTAALLSDLFPTRLRNTGIAISYHIATGVFGGMTPLILTTLTSMFSITVGPTLWIIASGLIGIATLTKIKETTLKQAW